MNFSQLDQPRCTCDYLIAKPVTFRRSSVKKFRIWGTNLQNTSKAICKLYHADKGMLFCQTDQSGADAKIVAWLCRASGNYRKLFIHVIKPHIFVALHLFIREWEKIMGYGLEHMLHIKIEDLQKVPEWKELVNLIKESDNWPGNRRFYFMGKKTIHSGSYGMKAPTFRMDLLKESEGNVILSSEEASRFLGTFHSICPEIEEDFQADVKKSIFEENRTLRTFQGFPRYFGRLINEKFWREAYAFIPAATVACITAQAIENMQNYIEDNQLSWNMLNDKHDSMMVEAPEIEIINCAKKSKEFMEQNLLSPKGESLKMRAGVSIGYNWKPYDEKHNPQG